MTFVTITDKRDGQQRAAGVSLMLQDTLYISKEKRENVSKFYKINSNTELQC